MDGPLGIITQSEISQKKTNIIWYHLYVESKKMIQMNLFIKQKDTDIENKHCYQSLWVGFCFVNKFICIIFLDST